MPAGKDGGKSDLQVRVEKGATSTQDVLVFFLAVLNVRASELAVDEDLRAAFEGQVRERVALEVADKQTDFVSLLWEAKSEDGSLVVQVVVTPQKGAQANGLLASLGLYSKKERTTLGQAIEQRLAAVEGLVAPGKAVKVELRTPSVAQATWPQVKLDKKVPNTVFNLFDSLRALDDTRFVQVAGALGKPPSTEDREIVSMEVAWSLQKTVEALKDPKLEKLFVLLISSLLKKDRKACNLWAGSLAPSALQFILADSPMKDVICRNSFGVARQEWQLYALRGKTCVAIAVLACTVLEQWQGSFTPEDKAFLLEATDKLSTWPGLTVGEARGLWDRSTSRFVIVNGLARSKNGAEQALATLNKCPREIVCTRFPAPWRSRPEQEASFFYLYGAFAANGCKSAEDLCDALAQAYAQPSADIPASIRSLVEDPEVRPATKRDFLVTFISACRRWKPPAVDPKKAKQKEELKKPETAGLELLVLESIVKVFASPESAKAAAGSQELGLEIGKTLEAVLLLSSGDALYKWARQMRNEDRQTADATKRLLETVGGPRISAVLKAAGADSKFRYDEAKSKALIDGQKVWTHDGRKLGFFSECQKKAARPSEDIGQIIYMFIKLDLALSAGCSAKLVKAIDEGSECLANRFNHLVPEGTSLRKAINEDVRRGLGGRSLTNKEIDALLSYIGFFHPSFQSFLRHETAFSEMRDSFSGTGFDEMAFLLLEAIMKLLSLAELPAGHSVREVIADICDQIRGDPLTSQLLSKVLEALQNRHFNEVKDGFDSVQLRDCAKELCKASQLIQYKQARGVSESLLPDVERVIHSFLSKSPPKSWVSSFRSLDTVIFALEYMGKEDLDLAYERFEEECKNSQEDQLVDLIRCVRKIYPSPLAGTSKGMSPDMDVKQLIKSKAPKLQQKVLWHGIPFMPSDWDKVLEIAAAAADAMKQRYNVLMLPHHTQIIALLMFGFRVCGAGSSGTGFRELPKTLLARVGTGEGKSMIIGMLAAFVAKKGMRAHVINDDRLLTQRDFATNERMFKALGITASNSAADLKNQACKIVYCTGDDVEGSCLDSLTEGQVEAYEESLRETVLIVDEVDGMVFDKGVTSHKWFEDRDFSDMVNEWLSQLHSGGKITREWDDWRSMGEGSRVLQSETEAAFKEAGEKEEGHDYTRRGDEFYIMDQRTNKISENAWSLWLEILRSQRTDPPGFVHYKYVKAILCRLQCFMSYSCIFGLTGSLGQTAEKTYLAEHYEAVTFNVPFFLDTCRSDGGGVQGKAAPTHIQEQEPLASMEEQDLAVVALAAAKCSEVPVLVIAREPEDVDALAEALETELDRLYGAEPADAGGDDEDADEDEGVAGPRRVIKLLQNPRNPKEFVELVGCATEPVRSRSAGGAGGVRQRWPVTLTTAEGGRGHDYRVTDPTIDEKGGLLLILTWVPFSEREWIQFLGRTGRQDHSGQYAVLLSYEDEEVEAARSIREPEESFVQAMLRHSDQETSKMLTGFDDEITKGRLMHQLTSRYFTMQKQEKTTKRQDWDWKRLCEGYLALPDNMAIQKRFDAIIPPERRLVVDADDVCYEGEWKSRLHISRQTKQHPGDPGCLDTEVETAPEPSGSRRQATATEELIYGIRDISFCGMQRRILSAPEGMSSSPLLALCNVLLLRNQLTLPDKDKTISSQDLVAKVTTLLLDLHAGSRVADDARSMELQQAMDVAMEVLPSFRLGLELDFRFNGPADFVPKREFSVFDLLEIGLLHGWVVSPMDKEAYRVCAPHSHNELRQRLAQLEDIRQRLESGDDRGLAADGLQDILNDIQVIEDVPVIRDFFDRSEMQLTYEGIIQLHEVMGDREAAIIFRNHVFDTLLRNKDELLILATDASFSGTPVVWERLAAADSDTAYLDTNFREPESRNAGASRQPEAQATVARGPRLEGARTQQAGGPAVHEIRCERCGIINRYPASMGGRESPTLRCGACGHLQALVLGSDAAG